MANDILISLIGLLLMVIIWLMLPPFLTRQAMKRVVKILTKNKAFNTESAQSRKELGMAPRSLLQSMGRFRDYKPKALEMLIEYKVVLQTEDDRFYLDRNRAAIYRL